MERERELMFQVRDPSLELLANLAWYHFVNIESCWLNANNFSHLSLDRIVYSFKTEHTRYMHWSHLR